MFLFWILFFYFLFYFAFYFFILHSSAYAAPRRYAQKSGRRDENKQSESRQHVQNV